MKSTPVNWAAIIRLTALLPPPPKPMTLIFAACGLSSSSNSGRRARSFSIRPSSRRWGSRSLEDFTEPPRQAAGHAGEQPSSGSDGAVAPRPLAARTKHGQTDPGGKDRAVHDVGQPAHRLGQTATHRQVEDGL